MKTIKLYGHLGKQFGKIHRYSVDTPSEAIQLLCANYKAFEKALLDFTGEGYRIIVGKEDIPAQDLFVNTSQEIIKIIPVISGRGDSNLNMIILGAAIMFAAPWAVTMTGAFTGATGALLAGAAVNFGAALVLGGIAGLLFSPPSIGTTVDPKRSAAGGFDGAVNTSRQGMPIPVGYGKLLVGSAIISAGFSSVSVPIE